MSSGVRKDIDVSSLPTYAFGHRSLMWWGTLGLMAIESMVFALTVVSYFYLRSHASAWPMDAPPPSLLWGTMNTVLILVSCVPNHLTKAAAVHRDRIAARRWLGVTLLFALAFLALRVLEFTHLNVRWDGNAYGSVVWMLMGLHTAHLLTDAYDSAVLLVLLFTGPFEGRRYVDVSENAMYWYFVVFSWLPIYAVVYWGSRV